jgi:multisubunit Na+/H+ antiporter MnhB subunit
VIEIGLSAMILIAALTAVLTNSRLGAVAALGIIGYSVALIYTIYGAPDLAMAQFLVETLTVILFVLVFYHLPGLSQLSTRKVVVRDTAIAVASGALVTGLVLAATSEQFSPTISTYFTSTTVEEAHSRNIVNVILTDYRALDSLGEITVLALAGAGVFALLKLRPAGTGSDEPPIAASGAVHSLILQASTRVLLPVLLLFSVFLLLRGHNDPGGGFTGGLVAAAAFALYAIAYDAESARRALRVEPQLLIGAGLLLAVGSGLVGLLAGDPFLTAKWAAVDLPGFGHIELSTVLLFDVGIYLVVLGVTLVIILSLAEE